VPILTSCWADPDKGLWGGSVGWSAWGGPSSEYHYYAGSVGPEFELPGPYHEFSAQVGSRHGLDYYTVSGEEVVKQSVWLFYDDCPD
jgi:hypothetical protein